MGDRKGMFANSLFLPLCLFGFGVGAVVVLLAIRRRRLRLYARRGNEKDKSQVDRFIMHSEELLRERRLFVVNQPVRLESEFYEQRAQERNRTEEERVEKTEESPTHTQQDPFPDSAKQEMMEERAAYRLCYERLNLYFCPENDQNELDEERGYFNELEEWPTDNTDGMSLSLTSLPVIEVTKEPEKGEERAEVTTTTTTSNDADCEEGGRLVDWNERFQVIVGKLRTFNYSTPLVERFDTNRALIHLAQDFIYSSSSYGKIIISEVFVPKERKTIQPIPLGGLVGGEKYIVHNILFKFALDSSGLYGSDYAASKVAGHELKGLMAYFNSGIKDICLPLMALIDYRGFRLIAMSILPINKETIVYGSNDYGKTIHADDKDTNEKMRIAAEILNIKPHFCGTSRETSKKLWSPADLEGHKGEDDRLYLLDFSRVMPPEFPKPGVKMAHLFRLLRPEFVRNYPVPLCSDGFSGFIRIHNPDAHNAELEKATNYLTTVLVPAYAPQLQRMIFEAKEKGNLENFRLTDAVHSAGINIRYLGILRHHMTDKDCKTLLFVEMCARVVKNNLRLRLRERMRKLRLPLDEPYHRLVVDYLNLILGHNDQSEEYWTKNLKSSLIRKFELGLTTEETEPSFPLKCILDYFSDNSIDGKLILFKRLQKICGLKFSQRVNEEFSLNKNCWVSRGEQPLDDTDMEEIGLRVKHMNIVTYAQGYSLHLKGNMAWGSNPVNAQRFYKMALEKFEEALSTDPTNSDMLCHCAEISTRFLEGEEKNLANLSFSMSHPQAKEASNYFRRAINANPADSYALFQYAQFLDKCGEIDEAEEFYLRSLEINPNNAACLQEYGNFLTLRKGCHEDAERFFLRSSKCTELNMASEQAAAIEISRRGITRSTRHGSTKDFLQLLKHADDDFRERARSEIDLVSSPTLRWNSDEVLVPEKKGRKGKEKSEIRRVLTYNPTGQQQGATSERDEKEKEKEGEKENENENGEKEEEEESEEENAYENENEEEEDGYENENEEEEDGSQNSIDEDEHGGEAEEGYEGLS